MIFDLFGTLFSILLFIVAIIIVRRWEKENILGKKFILLLKIVYFGGAIFGTFLLIYQIIFKCHWNTKNITINVYKCFQVTAVF